MILFMIFLINHLAHVSMVMIFLIMCENVYDVSVLFNDGNLIDCNVDLCFENEVSTE